MSSDWKEVRLGEVCKSNKSSYSAKDNWTYINYLDTGNITENRITEIQHLNVEEDNIPSRAKRKVEENDIVYSTVRPNQRHYGIIKKQMKNMLVSTGFTVISAINDKAYSDYIYYYLTQNDIVESLHSMGEQSTSTYPAIKPSDIENLSIPLPPLSEQKAIADTLSCLDDKIELNNKINKTLEEMAQAIFKSWFVDFEPFQDGEFVDSELGGIPKGWRVGTISDLGEVIGGSTPSKACNEYYTDNGIAWITPKDLSNNKDKFISRGNIDITELGFKNSSTRIMPKGTVLFSSRAPIGYMAIAKNDVTTNQGFKSIVPKKDIGNGFVYYFIKYNISAIENRAIGSTFKEVSGSIMKLIPALIPTKEVLIKFQDIMNLYFNEQMLLEQQTQTLTALRDTFLPKLMSGEIRVPYDEN